MKRSIIILGVGVGVGYLLGSRAGREQYDRMRARARTLWEDPRVARARRDAEAYARKQAPIIADKAEAFAKTVPGRVTDGVQHAAESAATAAGRTTVVAHDIAGKTSIAVKDAVAKAKGTARKAASA